MSDPVFEPLTTSILTVALAEIGDKTQLLSLVLAARFRNKAAIVAGIEGRPSFWKNSPKLS